MASERLSPGVYSKITDLSTYVQDVPSTIAFIPFISDKGQDNVMLFFGNREAFINEYGTCNYEKYGVYAEGLFTADNFIKNSPSLYAMRVLPDDARYANLGLYYDITNSSFKFENIVMADKDDARVNFFDNITNRYPIVLFYPTGRGVWYNDIKIKLSLIENEKDIYVIDIYTKNKDGNYDISETFNVSFRRDLKDFDGDSLFIEQVLDKFSKYLRCYVNETYSFDQLNQLIKNDIITNNATMVELDGIIDENGTPENPQDGQKFYVTSDVTGELFVNINKVVVYNATTSQFDVDTTITFNNYDYFKVGSDLYIYLGGGFIEKFSAYSSPFIAKLVSTMPDDLIVDLSGGSEGSFFDSNNQLNSVVVNQFLTKAYSGLLDRNVVDRDNYYFSVVFDCGYPKEVKSSIIELCRIQRRDCIAILSNGKDITNITDEIKTRRIDHPYNTYYAALYTGGSKVYNEFEGRYVRVNPTYHMAQVIPYSDKVANLYHAPAGLNRALLENIESILYNPTEGEQEQLYLNQLNPLLKFAEGYTIWGQQTTQKKSSALQSINIVRTVLYIDTALRRFCKFFLFEQNDAVTWNQVSKEVTSFLEQVKNERGLYSYSVDVGATEYEKKRKTFHVNVELTPMRTVEKILLNFFVK